MTPETTTDIVIDRMMSAQTVAPIGAGATENTVIRGDILFPAVAAHTATLTVSGRSADQRRVANLYVTSLTVAIRELYVPLM
jgi:hypothetical protein